MNEETKNTKGNLDLKEFVDRLVEEKKLPENLEKEVIDQIKSDLLNSVEDRVNAIIINNLSDSKLEEFNKMLDTNISDEEMQKFCSENIPNLSELIATELIVFKQSYLS
jgi:broad-specificity NMP kinase